MLELRHDGSDHFHMGFAGDTLNTAVYMARLGASVDYVTALGDDRHSDQMVAAWKTEGVGCDLIARVPGRLPGLYMIETDAHGERRFLYWRDKAPARDLFVLPAADRMMEALMGYDSLFLSGISLAIWGEQGRAIFFAFLDRYRRAGGRVVFDTNWRAPLWPSRDGARRAYEEMLRRTDIALPGMEDVEPLWGRGDAAIVLQRVSALGPREVVLKLVEPGCLVFSGGEVVHVPAIKGGRVVDTTAAGDSFAAGFLAARGHLNTVQAARCGARLAAVVVAHRGALIDRAAMPRDLF